MPDGVVSQLPKPSRYSQVSPQHVRPPKAGHNKAGWSDFRNQRFEPDMGKMRKVALTPERQGSEEIAQSKNAENAENAETKTRKMQKMRKMRLALM